MLLALALWTSLAGIAGAQAPARLVKEVDTQSVPDGIGSDPHNFLQIGSTVMFAASTASQGGELWRTDGTPGGTVLLKSHVTLSGMTDINGTVFLRLNDGVHGTELWMSDGTAAGTTMVADINPGAAGSGDEDDPFVYMNGAVYFPADDGTHGAELWKTDGTAAGTTMVKDIYPEQPSCGSNCSSAPGSLTIVNGTLFFVADDGVHGRELWKSDGTGAGTVLVKDINPGGDGIPYSSTALQLVEFNGRLLLVADDGVHGAELWKSDGTSAGTVLLKDINPGGNASTPGLTAVTLNGFRLFSAYDANGNEIWKTDGTAAGTVLVKTVGAYWEDNKYITLYAQVGDEVFFNGDDGVHGPEPWRTDGTTAGTVLIKDINPSGFSDPYRFTNANGVAFFRTTDPGGGESLWRSDGTTGGTVLLEDFVRTPSNFAALGGQVLFAADDGVHDREPWVSDGTVAGTFMLRDIVLRAESFPVFSDAGGIAYFSAFDGFTIDLWKTDGTDAGTVLIKGGPCTSAVGLGGATYFGAAGCELWKTDGTPAGTVMVSDVTLQPETKLLVVGGALYFGAGSPAGSGLFTSDGTSGGTVLVKDTTMVGSSLIAVGSAMFFIGNDGVHGRELWKSDGTTAGTGMVADIVGGSGGSFFDDPEFTVVGAKLFFHVSPDPDGSSYLGVSDGTDAGTGLVVPSAINPIFLANMNGTLYFSGDDGSNGGELWRSDGTPGGTFLLKDIVPGSGTSFPQYLTGVGGTLFFAADDGTGRRLWESDGTASGTVPVASSPAIDGNPSNVSFLDANGRLIFTGNDGMSGAEVWRSDGTAAGTVLLADVVPGPGGSTPTGFTIAGSNVFFSATDDLHGMQPWVIPNIATCGDGVVDPWEQCDDGDSVNTNACKNDCTMNVCGDGVVNTGVEECDDGNTVSGDCCSATCQFEAAGANCADDGRPCTADQCDGAGTCHVAGNAGATCRPSVGPCDLPDTCDGVQSVCPLFDAVQPGSVVCRMAAGPCDVMESCTGFSPFCPADTFAGVSSVCRPSVGPCDLADHCAGTSAACPADAKSTATCRPAAGVCDVAESCDGVNDACPADAFMSSTFVCRPAVNVCDLPESCTGSSAACPADAHKPDSDGDGVCDDADYCPGGVPLVKPNLVITKQTTPPGDDGLSFKGTLTLPHPFNPPLDPVHNGFRLRIDNADFTPVMDVQLPSGAYDPVTKIGWKVTGSNTPKMTYMNKLGFEGITQLAIIDKSAKTPGLIQFKAKGKKGAFAVGALPVMGTLIFDPADSPSAECAVATFPGPAPTPHCAKNASGDKVQCK